MMRGYLVVSLAYAMEWTLGLQLCPDAEEWTLHGLWPSSNDCSGPPFDPNAISSIESDLEAKWPSCYGKGGGEDDFWSHEWEKHGTCSGMQELDFFNTALALQQKYNHLCSGHHDKHACELSCSGATSADIQCSSPDSARVHVSTLGGKLLTALRELHLSTIIV
jgi:ribonuclease I